MKKLLTYFKSMIVFILVIGNFQLANAQFRVIGYLPTWNGFPGSVNNVDLTKLTHINIAFGNPNSSGAVTGVSTADVATVVNKAHGSGVKVLLSIGGAGAPGGTYHTLLSNSSNMNNFVTNLTNFAVNNNLDGIDVDVEGDVLDGSQVTASQYQSFVTALGTALHAKNKLMTSAVANWFGDQITNTAASKFDWINIMSYDGAIPGSGDAAGPHSSYAMATGDFNYWNTTKGVPGSKISIGVPFYGYGWGSYAVSGNNEISYSTIVSKYSGAENNDQVGSGGNAIYYNGIPTIKKKTTFAMQNASGIMIWELTEDATGAKSLLSAINSVVKGSNQSPSVSITSPANNAAFTAPASITINATASDADGTVSKVDFYNGSTLLGSDNSSPYSFSWTNVGAGTYTLTAKATDNGGAVTTSSAISVTVNVPESPYGGTAWTIPGTIQAENFDLGGQGVAYNDADAANSGGQYRTSDGVDIEATTDAGGGYNIGWTAAGEWLKYTVTVATAGTYDLSVRIATTATGKSFHVEMDGSNISGAIALPNTGAWQTWQTITIKNISLTAGQKIMRVAMDTDGFNLNYVSFASSGTTNQAPSVSITSPANNASFTAPASITINATASDADGTVSKVDFYNGSTLLGSDNSSPYSFAWASVAAGTYSLTAKATDNSNAVTTSSAVSVTVTGTTTNTPPTVSISGPANNATFTAPASITITANAADSDGTVSKVDFYNGATLLGSDNSSPYSFAWTNVAAATYTLTAKATDNSGAVTTSAAITVKVNPATTNNCTGIAQYVENNGYVAGSVVQNGGAIYTCRPWPNSGWCNGAAWAYGPGTGTAWADAWTQTGTCSGARTSSANVNVLSPNPTTGTINVGLNTASKVQVFNSYGYEVMPMAEINANGTIDISSLPAGIYVIKIDTGGELITQKIVKQ